MGTECSSAGVPTFRSPRVCLNQHHWLAIRMLEEGIDFQQRSNALLRCGHPARLQELDDSLTAGELLQCGQKWLAAFTAFITDKERQPVLSGGVRRPPDLPSSSRH